MGKMGSGGTDTIKGGVGHSADQVDKAAEAVGLAAHTATVLFGGFTSPVTAPLAEGATIVSSTAKTVKAIIHSSDGNYQEAGDELIHASVSMATMGTAKQISKQVNKSTGKILTEPQQKVTSSAATLYLKMMLFTYQYSSF